MKKRGPKARLLDARFDEKFIAIGIDGCWIWTAATNYRGYGKISVSRTRWSFAHRVSWELHNGPIPDDLCVLHHCDNTSCVNPAHLFLGTKADNLHDMTNKGRRATREQHGRAKFSDKLIDEIRNLGGTMLHRELAAALGVSRGHVGAVLSGKRRV